MSLLRTQNISMAFGSLVAVDDVSISVSENEVLGLVGPNGAGKTTLFNIITGFQRPTRGAVHFKDSDISSSTANQRALIGMARTFQTPKLFGTHTVADNVRAATLPLRLQWSARKSRPSSDLDARLNEILDLVGLAAHAGAIAGDLAYGLQRRLEIARALMTEPALLLLDEPAAGMPPLEAEDVRAIIQKIRDRGTTVIVVDHNMKLIMNVCSRVIVLHQGAVICDGPPEVVRKDPAVIRAYLG